MAGFTHCAACGAKLGHVTLFCAGCGRPYCSFACRSRHLVRDCAGERLTAAAQPRASAPDPRNPSRAG
ncbi:MAG TPA: hypothetical protein VFW33_03105 [Gemmataceae bacterium]|nr:hypothetical protein [Gemmataceae bacterium]